MKLSLLVLFLNVLHQTYSYNNSYPDAILLDYFRSDDVLRDKYDISDTGQTIPENFDARENWPDCKSIGEIVNQKKCRNYWAVVYCGVLSDRVCITTKGNNKEFRASVEDITLCCVDCVMLNATHMPCGVYSGAENVVEYMAQQGVVSGGDVDSGIGCLPTTENLKNINPGNCLRKCSNPKYKTPYEKDKIRLTHGALEQPLDIRRVQIEIMTHGPVFASLFTSDEFKNTYNNKEVPFKDVFTGGEGDPAPASGEPNHGVRVIGWGVEGGVPYWLAANSWGENWGGLKGFFKIKRGGNLLEIESSMVALYPKIEKSTTGCAVVYRKSTAMLLCAFCLIYMF